MFAKRILAGLVILLLANLACGLGSMNFQGGEITFDTRITQDQLNAATFNINIGNLFSGTYSIDLQPGKVVILGDVVQPDGTEETGSIEIGLFAQNGALQVQIISVDTPGIKFSPESIQQLQESVAQGLQQIFDEQNFISVNAVEISEDEIVITFKGTLSGSESR